jgi:spermidine synthase
VKKKTKKSKTSLSQPPTKSQDKPSFIWPFFVLAFVEGATVMAVELFGAKMMTPYYGSSLIVWTSVIGVTLLCLTIGYYLGGRLSMKYKAQNLVFVQLMISALLIGLMPIIAHDVLKFTGEFNFYVGAILSAILLFGFPLVFLGSTSPVIILLATKDVKKSGKNAGFVYSISTVGGIFMTFLLGFFIIEEYGITIPNMFVSAILLITTVSLLYRNSRFIFIVVVSIFFLFETFGVYKTTLDYTDNSDSYDILYESEGLLGQLRVLDEHYPDLGITDRSMLVNGIPQTFVDAANGYSYWYYVHMLSTICSSKPAGSDVLLLGFGGGSVANELTRLDLNIDAVEIDKRMYQLSKDYFSFDSKNTNFIVDDARHYLKISTKKYDVIIFDMIKGEVQPPYALTKESFAEGLKILKPGGLLLVNFQGHFDELEGLPFRSIVATLKAAGFTNTEFHVENCEPGSPCDFIVIGSVDVPDISFDKNRINKCCLDEWFVKDLLNGNRVLENDVGKGEAIVFTDDLPVLEHINLKSIVEWRTNMIDNSTKMSLEEGVRLFK